MSEFTPRTTGDDLTGLQDVLAFIADFEMEESGSNVNHDSDDWMEDEIAPMNQIPDTSDASLQELFVNAVEPVTTPNSKVTNMLGLASPSTSVGSHSDSVKPTRRHRVSRKEELDYLRKKVTEMENQLTHLKDKAEGGQSPALPAPTTPQSKQAAMKLEQSVALWKKMAERQKSQRELVESENSKLREKLKTQVRMAKSLQRILRKRERTAEQITAEAPKRLKPLPNDTEGVPTGAFDTLVQSLDMLHSFTDERMALCPVATGSQPSLREKDVKYNDLTGMFLEFMQCKLVPFDLDAVNRANWRHTTEPGIKFNNYFEEQSIETTDNMVLRSFGVEIKQDKRVATMGGRQAIRRYVESDRIVIVRSSVIDRVELSGSSTGGLTFQDIGWIVLKDVTGLVSASGPMTMFQSYSALTPDVDLDAHWEVGAVTDFVLQSREDIEHLTDLGSDQTCPRAPNSLHSPLSPTNNTCLHNMQATTEYDTAELDDLLNFVGTFDIEDVYEPSKPATKSPNEPLEMSDSAWYEDLELLFVDNETVSITTSESVPTTAQEEKSSKLTKTLTLTPAAPGSKATKKNSSRPRVSRKEELEYLRTKVKEMETELHELKENSDSDKPTSVIAPPPSNEQENPIQSQHSVALWKSMAERRKNQREFVEVENVKLRQKLKTQVRMANSLHRILVKRTRIDDQSTTAPPKRVRLPLSVKNSSTNHFEEMLQCLDELFVRTSKCIANSRTASMSNPVIRKRDVKYTDDAGMFLEFQDSKFLPFDMNTVCRAMWRFLTETGHKYNNYIEEHVEMQHNTMLRRFGVEIKHGDTSAVLYGRQVTRRYLESNQVVFVRHSIIDDIQLPGATTGGLTFRESGWIVIKNSTEIPGTGAATVTQAYSTMSPDIDLNSQWEIGALTDFVLQSREDVEVGNDAIIENLLLEETRKQTN